jgi:ribosome assembly protein SQT1
MAAPAEDDDLAPAFIAAGEAEEVVVDETAPVDDEGDDADMEDAEAAEAAPAAAAAPEDPEPGETLQPFATVAHHRGPVYSLASLSPPSSPATLLLSSGSGDDTAAFTVLSLPAGDDAPPPPTTQPLPGHSESVASAGYSADGSLLATADYAGTVSLWSVSAGSSPPECRLDRTLPPGPSDAEWLSWHPLGNVFAVGSTDGTVWMFLAKTGAVMQVFAGHDPAGAGGGGGATCGAFSLDGRHLLTGGGEGSFRVWNPKTGTPRAVVRDGQEGGAFVKGEVTCLHQQLGAGADNVAVGGSDGTVGIVNLGTRKPVAALPHSGPGAGQLERASVEAVRWSPVGVAQGSLLASAGVDGVVKVWENGICRAALKHASGVTCMEWLVAGAADRQIATGAADGRVRVWDTRAAQGSLVRKLDGHTDMVLCLSVRGNVVAAGGDDGLINVWVL